MSPYEDNNVHINWHLMELITSIGPLHGLKKKKKGGPISPMKILPDPINKSSLRKNFEKKMNDHRKKDKRPQKKR